MPTNTEIKRLQNSKQNRISFVASTPNERVGKDGDLRLSMVPNKGLFMFYKLGSAWYGTRMEKLLRGKVYETQLIAPNKLGKTHGELTRAGNDLYFNQRENGNKKVFLQGDTDWIKAQLLITNVTNESKETMFTDPTFLNTTGNTTVTIFTTYSGKAILDFEADKDQDASDKMSIQMLDSTGSTGGLNLGKYNADDTFISMMRLVDTGSDAIANSFIEFTSEIKSTFGSGNIVTFGDGGSGDPVGFSLAADAGAGLDLWSVYASDGGNLEFRNEGAGGSGGTLYMIDPRATAAQSIHTMTGNLDVSGDVDITSTHQYEINNTKVLDATSLGSAVVGSSLTSVGTLGSLALGGALTTTSTIDGRDVATDGTKLDGIEASATADQTAGQILTLIEDGVDSVHYKNGSIDNEHLANNAVDTDEIADDAVTEDKLANTLLAEIDANTAKTTNATHSGDVTGSGALTIAADAVTYAKMQDVSATDRILGRDTSGAGIIEEITPANLRTMINVEDGATADQTQADINGLAITTTGIIGTGEWNATVIPSAKLDGDTAHLSGTQTFSGAKSFSDIITTRQVQTNIPEITTAVDKSTYVIKETINETAADANNYHTNLELSIVNTDTDGYHADGLNFIFCHNESTIGGGGASRTPHFKVALDGSIYTAGNLTVAGNDITCNGYKYSGGNELINFGGSNLVQHKAEYQVYNAAGDDDTIFQIHDVDGDDQVTFLTVDCNDDGSTVAGTCAFSKPITNTSTITSSNGVCSGTGALDTGSSNITTTGTVTTGPIVAGSSTITTSGVLTGGNGVCGGPSTWTISTGGYCRTADQLLYIASYKGDETWANALTASGGVGSYSYTDISAAEWIAPYAGKLTKIAFIVRSSAVADEMKIYVFKGSVVDGQSSLAFTSLGVAVNALGATNLYYETSQDISSSNTFSAGDAIFVAFGKTEDTGTSTYNFSVTLTGEYT